MAGSVNRVTLIGNLGKDPEIKSVGTARVANFSLACSESWKDKQSGERKEKTQWINVVVWNEQIVGVVERFVKKGSKIYLEGSLETRSYEKDGKPVYVTEVVLRPFKSELVLLDKAGGDGEAASGTSAKPAQGFVGSEDEIPFAAVEAF